MRTTIRLDDDLAQEIRRCAAGEGVGFGRMVNHVLRSGLKARSNLRSSGRPFREKVVRMGVPTADLTKALALAGELEDAEVLKRLQEPG